MLRLPVIVGMGGMNAAGRSSGFHSFKRIIYDALPAKDLENTWEDLARRMGIPFENQLNDQIIQQIKAGTLVRKIELFDPAHVPIYQALNPETLSPTSMALDTSAAGQIPSNFEPGNLYPSTHHPRSLRLGVYGASDALNSIGIEWTELLKHIHPDEVSVYAGGALTQVDPCSLTGLVSHFMLGKSFNSKMMAFSFSEMIADFINSYMINSVGSTGTNIGACATFLYNLKQGISDIQQKKSQVVIVGCTEAPIAPEVIAGFSQMKALASDKKLAALDNKEYPDYRRASRPFSTNAGFVLSESAQFVVLMSDELALKTGANILGSVPNVFINADANKKSITAPGIGNYITMMKATGLAKMILGEKALQQHTAVQAHGSGTPQNRVTESHILNEVAKTFNIEKWPVSAIKAYVGHSVASAAGDQLCMTLGAWAHGFLPGIKTIDHIADDVHHSHLNILMDHQFIGEAGQDILATVINSKGFGGNNASAVVLSPAQTQKMLEKKHGKDSLKAYRQKNETVKSNVHLADEKAIKGQEKITYHFGEAVMDESSVSLTQERVTLSKFSRPIRLPTETGYEEYCDPED